MANNLHMNGRQFEVEKAKLKDERQVLKELKATYQQASKDIARKIRIQQGRIDVLLKDIDNLSEVEKSILQAATYQKQFQERLKKQIDSYIDTLNAAQHESMDKYLQKCYETGFIGAMYDMHGQGVPIIAPINQNQVARATALTPKLSRKMYGTYAGDVKQAVRREISRGIATASTYSEIARNINMATNMGFNKMMRIARTEGHRIQAVSAFDAQHAARDAGADVVKQWDAALDGRTRDTHRQLDGQIRELDEPFEVYGMTAMYPSDFGIAGEDINCRCALLQRARWALGEAELETLKEKARFHGLAVDDSKAFGHEKAKDFADFKYKYMKVASDHNVNYARDTSLFPVVDLPRNGQNIRPNTIFAELEKTLIGSSAIDYLNDNNLRVNIKFGRTAEKARAMQIGDNITLYVSNVKDDIDAACAIIHEVTHHKYNIGQCQWAEVVCFIQEYKHAHNIDRLSYSEKRRIIKAVKEAYPDLNWKKGGYKNGKYF